MLFSPLAAHSSLLFLNPRDTRTARQVGWTLRDWGVLRALEGGAHEQRLIFPPGWFSRLPKPFTWLLARMAGSWLTASPATQRVVVLSFPQYAPIVRQLNGIRSIYYWSDDFFSYWPARRDWVMDAEAAAVHETDLTITASISKCDELRARFPDCAKKIHFLMHGHHPSLRTLRTDGIAATLPSDLNHLPRPVLGHWGNITKHLDMEIALAVAKAFPTASLVFIGPISTNFEDEQAQAFDELRNLSNVYFIGPKPYDRIAEYIEAFDVCLCLYRPDIYFCEVVNPSKVRDYLASGRPIVSTATSEVIRAWPSLVNAASCADEFVDEIRNALNDRESNDRLTYAREHSYEKTTGRLRDLILGDSVQHVDD